MSPHTVEVPIRDESIRLGQLLKLASAVESGVMAREVISAGAVFIDGQPEHRRGAQVRLGQQVQLRGADLGLDDLTLIPVAED